MSNVTQNHTNDPFKPECSIIIPVFNGLEYTQTCLETLLNCDEKVSFEIIVVDNGSTDGVETFLRRLQNRLTLVEPGENLGFARANNLAAGVARGTYLILLNNDTIPEPGWLDALVHTAASEDSIAVVGSKLLFPGSRLIQHAGVAFNHENNPYHIYENFPEDHSAVNHRRDFNVVTGACMLVKADRYRQIGGLDEEFINGFEDIDFCLKVREQGWRVVYEPDSVVLHHFESSAGRHRFEQHNGRLFFRTWSHKIVSDDADIYDQDGYSVIRQGINSLYLPKEVKLVELANIAREILKQGNLEEALKQYLELHKHTPHDASVMHYLVQIYERRGDYSSAGAMLNRLNSIHPSIDTQVKLANNALKRKQYVDAQQKAENVLGIMDENDLKQPDALAILGDAMFKSGDLDSAEKQFKNALEKDTKHLRGLTGLGTVALARSDHLSASSTFDQALAVNPHHARAILGKGLALLGIGQMKTAASMIVESLQIEPDNSWALTTILPVLAETGRLQIAHDVLANYLDIYPDDPAMLLAQAGVMFALGSYVQSRTLLNSVLNSHPDYPGSEDLNHELQRLEALNTRAAV